MQESEEVARARLAFISAGRPPLGAPRRASEAGREAEAVGFPGAAAAEGAPVAADPAAAVGRTAPQPPGGLQALRAITLKHALVVAVLLVAAVGVTVFALSRSSATQVPIAPVAVTSAPSRPAPPTPVPTVRVHVAGAVTSPGVVVLPAGSIVRDAIAAAGGLAADADPAHLNLAAPVGDGMQILIGSVDAPEGTISTPDGGTPGDGTGGPLNLNTATQGQLEALPGIGPVTAAAILAWREENGRFSTVEELQEIAGIGPRTFEKLAPLVTT